MRISAAGNALRSPRAASSCACAVCRLVVAWSSDWREMKHHVSAVIRATTLPCMLYNNPIAYGTDFLPEHIRELAAERRLLGLGHPFLDVGQDLLLGLLRARVHARVGEGASIAVQSHRVLDARGEPEGHPPRSAADIEGALAFQALGFEQGEEAVAVGAMVLAFVALVALANGLLGGFGNMVGIPDLSFQRLVGYVFAPIMYLLGIPWNEAGVAGGAAWAGSIFCTSPLSRAPSRVAMLPATS